MLDSYSRFQQSKNALIQLAVLVILISIFITIAADRIWKLRVIDEKTGMEHTIATIQSALGIHLTAIVVKEGLEGIAALDRSDPMDLLDPPPVNYIGKLENPDPAAIEGPAWYFDSENRILVYRVLNEEYFITDLEGAHRALFHLHLSYEDLNNNGEYDPNLDRLSGLQFKPLEPYSWRIDYFSLKKKDQKRINK